ncbi:MAG: hypothetical protein ABSE76_00465 [Minisyncoccia bacterium]|jgi:hypothetical protein
MAHVQVGYRSREETLAALAGIVSSRMGVPPELIKEPVDDPSSDCWNARVLVLALGSTHKFVQDADGFLQDSMFCSGKEIADARAHLAADKKLSACATEIWRLFSPKMKSSSDAELTIYAVRDCVAQVFGMSWQHIVDGALKSTKCAAAQQAVILIGCDVLHLDVVAIGRALRFKPDYVNILYERATHKIVDQQTRLCENVREVCWALKIQRAERWKM